MSRERGLVGALAARARLTEGQLYSSAITLAFAGLLASGLGGVHGVVSDALSATPLAPVPAAQLPPVVVPTPASTAARAPEPPLSPFPPPYDAVAAPVPQPFAAPSPEPPSAGPSSSPAPTAAPCAAQPVDGPIRDAILAADAAAGGGLPDKEMLDALSMVDGCSPSSSPSPGQAGAPVCAGADIGDIAVLASCEPRR